MSDPTNPTAPPAQEPAAAPPAAAAHSAPAPVAAAPQAPAAKPPYVNPWQGRTPAPVAPKADAPAPVAAQPSQPAAPASDPRVDALMAVLGETVAQDRATLPPNVAAAVLAIAGDDIVAMRKAINAMRANGLAVSPLAPPAPLPAPSTTLPPSGPAATPAAPTGDAAVRAEWLSLKSRGAHIAAASFYTANAAAIERGSNASN
jgi:hypothetical protein